MSDLIRGLDFDRLGGEIHDLARELFPVCRSITGDGVRDTLRVLQRFVPLEIREAASGTEAFDWTVPPEWNIRDAWVKNQQGERVIDFRAHNLHVLSYSVPVRRTMSLAELKEHLFTLPEKPDLIPYRTSYYQERWGFCLSHRQLESLEEGDYEVVIDSTLEPGHLSWGELFLPGESEDTVLFSTHVCHPSLANDNLSGVGVCTFLAARLAEVERRYSYRFLFIPGTIGSITWLALNGEEAARVRHGLVAANLGDGGAFHYKRSQRGDAEIDRAVAKVLEDSGEASATLDFVPYGYDERQYCSPGFDLAVGLLSRTPWGRYPEYHTSADDLDLIRPEHLGASLERYLEIVRLLETNRRFKNQNPHCEPQLGKRGLYPTIGGAAGQEQQLALLWVLNQSDGERTLLDVAERSGMTYAAILAAAEALENAGLLESV